MLLSVFINSPAPAGFFVFPHLFLHSSAMNNKQKIFAIVGVMAFITWLYLIFNIPDIDVRVEYWENQLSLMVTIGCAIGFWLFKDKK